MGLIRKPAKQWLDVKMAKQAVKFLKIFHLEKTGDQEQFQLTFAVVDKKFLGQPEEVSKIKTGIITIIISDTLADGCWKLSEKELKRVVFEEAKRHVRKKIYEKALSLQEVLRLDRGNRPEQCEFDPEKIDYSFDKYFIFPEKEITPEKDSQPAIKEDIVEVRPNIFGIGLNLNALFHRLFKKK